MRIGTPLSPSATRVMLLGSGELGKEVIIALQRLGVEVIAVDRYANAPGHQVAHRAHVISMTDGAALRRLMEQERPHLIVPEIEAIATDMLVEIEREGLAEVIPTARAARLTMNREGIRRLAAEELGLPTSPYTFADSLDELRAAIADDRLPVHRQAGDVVVGQGPVDGQGAGRRRQGLGLRRGRRPRQPGPRDRRGLHRLRLRDHAAHRACARRTGRGGDLLLRADRPCAGERRLRRILAAAGDDARARWNARATSRAVDIGNLGGRGIFGVELFVKGDEVWFSEVSPRPHDTGLVTLATQRLSEFELHARAILGLPVDVSLRAPGASAVIYGGMDEKGIAFEGVAEALAVPRVDLRLFGKPESFIKRRMGVAVANGDDTDEARSRAKLAASRVKPVKA